MPTRCTVCRDRYRFASSFCALAQSAFCTSGSCSRLFRSRAKDFILGNVVRRIHHTKGPLTAVPCLLGLIECLDRSHIGTGMKVPLVGVRSPPFGFTAKVVPNLLRNGHTIAIGADSDLPTATQGDKVIAGGISTLLIDLVLGQGPEQKVDIATPLVGLAPVSLVGNPLEGTSPADRHVGASAVGLKRVHV